MNERSIDILDLVAVIYGGRKLIFGGTILVMIAAAGLSLLLPNQYEATVQILPPKEQKKGFGFADLLSDLPIPALRLGEKGTPADIFVATLKSPTTRRKMVERFDLLHSYESELMSEAIEVLAERTVVETSEEGTIVVTVLDEDSQKAANMADGYLEALDFTNQKLSMMGAMNRLTFIRTLLDEEEEAMEVAMKKLMEFQSEQNAISLENQAKAVINAAARLQMKMMELEMSKNALLNKGFSLAHPEIRDLEEKIHQHNQALIVLRDGQVDPQTELERIGSFTVDQNLFLPLRQIPSVALEYADIEKEVLVKKALMQMLLQQEAEALIESNNTTNTVQVLDYAVPADEHSRPRRFLIVFVAGVLSFFASTSYVIGGSYVHRLKQRWHAQNAG